MNQVDDLRHTLRDIILAWLRDDLDGKHAGRLDHPSPMQIPYQAGKFLVDATFGSVLWDLVMDGILIPGRADSMRSLGNESHKTFPYYTITPYGRQVLSGDGETPSPHRTTEFLAAARERLPDGDEAIHLFLEEAAQAFSRKLYLSAVMMLGVSAEALIEWLIRRMSRHLKGQARSNFDSLLAKKQRASGARLEILMREIDQHSGDFTPDLAAKLNPHLHTVLTLVKTYRDDVAHRRGLRIDRLLAESQLLAYPPMLSIAAEIDEALDRGCSVPVQSMT
jgi:hypothetical protein